MDSITSSTLWRQCEDVLSVEKFSVDEVKDMCFNILYVETNENNLHGRRLEPDLLDTTKTGWSRFLSFDDYVSLSLALICILGAGLVAGLTVAVVSLKPIDMRMKCRTGTDNEKISAKKLLPLVSIVPRHRLLVTLLLCNSVLNEALPTFLDNLVPTWAAVLLSVTAVLFFGEIIPSAIFTGPNQLQIASKFSSFIWTILALLGPIAIPISMLLDRLVPEEDVSMSRNEVRALVEIHREIAQELGTAEPFNEDEEDMVRGALSLSLMKANHTDVLKPTSTFFTLPLDGVLDDITMKLILDKGFSRVPISYQGVLIGYFMVKQLICLDPKEKTPISQLERYKPVCCASSTTLSHLLNEFQEGFSHMAFVSTNPELLSSALDRLNTLLNAQSTQNVLEGTSSEAIKETLLDIEKCRMTGIITLEDVIEVLLTEKVYDESDIARRRMLELQLINNNEVNGEDDERSLHNEDNFEVLNLNSNSPLMQSTVQVSTAKFGRSRSSLSNAIPSNMSAIFRSNSLREGGDSESPLLNRDEQLFDDTSASLSFERLL